MELKLNEREVKEILLQWAQLNFKDQFDTIHIDAQYGSFRSVEFSKSETEKA